MCRLAWASARPAMRPAAGSPQRGPAADRVQDREAGTVTVHAEREHHRDADVIERARLCITALVHLDEEETSALLAHLALTHGVSVTALAAALLDVATGHAPLGRCG